MLSRKELIKEHESIVKDLADVEKKLRKLRMEQEDELVEIMGHSNPGPKKASTKRKTRQKAGTTKPNGREPSKKRVRKKKRASAPKW